MAVTIFTYIGAFAAAYWLVFVLFEKLEHRKGAKNERIRENTSWKY